MIEINLLPLEHRRQERAGFKLPEIPLTKTLQSVGLMLLVLQLIASALAFYQAIEISSLVRDIKGLESQSSEIEQHKEETKRNNDAILKMKSLADRKFYWAALLSSLVNSSTKGLWFTALSVSDEKSSGSKAEAGGGGKYLRLQGSIIGPGEETALIGKFIKELKTNAFFSEVFREAELSDFVQKKIREYDVYDFSVTCYFKKEKAPTL